MGIFTFRLIVFISRWRSFGVRRFGYKTLSFVSSRLLSFRFLVWRFACVLHAFHFIVCEIVFWSYCLFCVICVARGKHDATLASPRLATGEIRACLGLRTSPRSPRSSPHLSLRSVLSPGALGEFLLLYLYSSSPGSCLVLLLGPVSLGFSSA